ncbi:hypothetical protein LG198_01310 [Methylobacillus arboreus]|uniref:hypothetical protein n=1 Tax=Methylobacillus arboreus TaxID=755170 RepID=UPI001E6404EA|nr:hypothetical protein [Methylobacillus arboreus]MCB5189367.1 hypothetical protein [Methylobacillus arboreus]
MLGYHRLNILLLVLCLASPLAWSADETGKAAELPPVTITANNPAREVGYHIGDILTRTVTLKVSDQYQILPTSLPIPGNQKRYRNKEQGIEIYASKLSESHRDGQNIYTLELSYQVFTSSIVAKPAALPPEFVKFSGNGKQFQVRIPSWNFRISPLAVYGSVNVSKDMSPLRGPLLISADKHRQTMVAALAILSLSLLGLLYILGNRAWLPRMGGPFARAYREVRKTSADNTGLETAISRLHQAFKQSCGQSVFSADEIIQLKPAFTPLKDDIERFFRLSRAVFFDSAEQGTPDNPNPWLRQFSRRCRDIERGMK